MAFFASLTLIPFTVAFGGVSGTSSVAVLFGGEINAAVDRRHSMRY